MSVLLKSKQHGLSLIELLVSLLITGIIMAGVINSLLATKKAYIFDEQIAYIQENARFALDIIARDLREAGYTGGCNLESADIALSLDTSTGSQGQFLDSLLPVRGYEGGFVNTFPLSYRTKVWGGATSTSDSIMVRRADGNTAAQITGSHPSSSANFLTTSNTGVTKGDVMMLVSSRCDQVGVFAVTGTPSTDKIQHNSGAAGSSSNCTMQLGGKFECVAGSPVPAAATIYTYPEGSQFFKMIAKAYYIGASSFDAALPSLYVSGISTGGIINSEELVSGVEDMQISYGLDTEAANRNGFADLYLPANLITLDKATAGSNWRGWDRVVSVRIDLRMRSRDEVLLKDDLTFGDKYMRQNVSTTVRLRNAVLPGNEVP